MFHFLIKSFILLQLGIKFYKGTKGTFSEKGCEAKVPIRKKYFPALFPLSHRPGAHSLGMTFDKKDSKIESSGLKEITAGKALKCS